MNTPRPELPLHLPQGLESLRDLALDLRWTWSHRADALWRTLDPGLWEQTENPWLLLQNISRDRLREAADDPAIVARVRELDEERRADRTARTWFGSTHAGAPLRCVAYFCMEFGLGEALPLYAGGLGVLAGDYLKSASDLGLPVVGMGLLYQQGYFHQMLGPNGRQAEAYPYNDPISLPIEPVVSPSGGWLHVSLDLPGRKLLLRVWKATVGRVPLYLLDSNDPLNTPVDRGITSQLYGSGKELRLLQEIVLGIGGWRALGALGIEPDICHLNEGHAAFALVERARSYMLRHSVSFWEALWVTRAANVFTTHTAVDAAFDRYEPELLQRFQPYARPYLEQLGVRPWELFGLGRRDPGDRAEPFNMAFLAMRGSGVVNAVSRLHEDVSRSLFRSLFPRWPEVEVPVTSVTNGVHMPSWDSPAADAAWEEACGKGCWRAPLEEIPEAIEKMPPERIWAFRSEARQTLVGYVRARLARQLGGEAADEDRIAAAKHVLDPNSLTLGFARRFTGYKRPDLLLLDPERLLRLLSDPARPVQLVVAGKAHPDDPWGKDAIQRWVEIARRPAAEGKIVFLADYDLTMAQELVRGVDVWINTPRPPWEACGTSGMKVLVNGGLNLSTMDGWWAEAYRPEVGWAVGGSEGGSDAADAEHLYGTLEQGIVPEFYRRDERGIPLDWIARIRASMATLAPRFSADRMVREYTEALYLPAVERFRNRSDAPRGTAGRLRDWQQGLASRWHTIHFGPVQVESSGEGTSIQVPVYLGDVQAGEVRVELYAEPLGEGSPVRVPMDPVRPIPGAANGAVYAADIETRRNPADFTPRVIPDKRGIDVPLESQLILWAR
jgi:glycogen phosphorylase